ncbi:MAG TPA: LysR family transcriptional regulator [Acidimicrobiales bacterium]|jgi:LysR family hydrogen peroxide-inducible transcriptional activator|nr:LysR family transcriptional regulator [Acidimicrobiales bacterium]HMS88346.1 LysR family transcriptional regulator [Acidimicrobiales bacterium]HRA33671.1 LysR family transcriptional regulator [Acidimicrobiales bacterium]
MDLRQLAALTAVADHRSFSAAARALHTVQSNISTHVARLERELGTALVERSTGELTEAGEVVVARARQIQAELAAITADVTSTLGEIAGHVRLGVIGTTGRWLVPALLTALGEAYPRIRLVTIDATTTSLLPQLASGLLDLAVVNLPASDPDVDVEALFEEDHVVLAPVGHPLAAHDRLGLTDLAHVPLLLEPAGTGFRDHLDADAHRAGVVLESQAEVDGMRLLASLAYQGFGAALLPASAVVDWTDGSWRAIPLDGTTRRGVGLALPRRGRQSAPARATVEVLRDVVAREVPSLPGLHLLA